MAFGGTRGSDWKQISELFFFSLSKSVMIEKMQEILKKELGLF